MTAGGAGAGMSSRAKTALRAVLESRRCWKTGSGQTLNSSRVLPGLEYTRVGNSSSLACIRMSNFRKSTKGKYDEPESL